MLKPTHKLLLWLATAFLAVGTGVLTLSIAIAPHPVESIPRPSVAPTGGIALPDGSVVLSGSDSSLVLAREGRQIRSVTLDDDVLAISANRRGDTIVAGTSAGDVVLLDPTLNITARITVMGRVRAVAVSEDGSLGVVHGSGENTRKWHVTAFSRDGMEMWTHEIGFNTRAIVPSTNGYWVGSMNARLREYTRTGVRSEVVLERPIESIATAADGTPIVGSDRGSVARVRSGVVEWIARPSSYAIRSIVRQPDGGIVVIGDESGRVHVVDGEGNVRFSQRVSPLAIRTIAFVSIDSVSVYDTAGDAFVVRIGAALEAERVGQLRVIRTTAGAGAAVSLLVTIIVMIPRIRESVLRLWRQAKRGRTAYILILPTIGLLVVFRYYTSFAAMIYSLTSMSLSNPSEFVGLDNFRALLSDRFFHVGFRNMILLVVANSVKVLSFPLIAALLVHHVRGPKAQQFYKVAFVVPTVVPGLVVVLMWRMIYSADVGLLNQVLAAVGLEHLQQAWLGDQRWALSSIMFAGFPWVGAFPFLLYLGGFINIDPDLYACARIDGAKPLQVFWRIELPLIRPQIRILLFFSYLGAVQAYSSIFVYTRGGPGTATYVPGLQMYLQITEAARYGYASAIGVALFLIVFVGTIALFRFNRTSR